MGDQLTFGQTAVPIVVQTLGPVAKFPGPGNRYHSETLLAYLTNIERLLIYAQTQAQLDQVRADMLDACQAALVLIKCQA